VAEGATEGGAEIRYSADADAVHALVRGPAGHPRSLRFAEVHGATATSSGRPLPCRAEAGGTIVDLDGPLSPVEPVAIAFPGADRSA
jgi:hypothetical protein